MLQNSAEVPKELRKSSSILMNRQLALRDRLQVSIQILQEAKFVSKDKFIERQESKQKPKQIIQFQILLMNFVKDVYDQFIVQNYKGVKNTLLIEQGKHRDECINIFSILLVVLYSKLGSNLQRGFKEDQDNDLLCENFRLVSLLLGIIFTDEARNVNKDSLEVALIYTEQFSKDLVSKFGQNPVNDKQVLLIEQIILSCLEMCVCFIPWISEDIGLLILLAKTLEQFFKLIDKFPTLFYVKQFDFTQAIIFKEFMLDSHTCMYFEKINLLFIVLKITIKMNEKSKGLKNKASLLAIDQLDMEILQIIDTIYLQQIRFFQISECFDEETKEQQNIFQVVIDKEWLNSTIKQNDYTLQSKSDQQNWIRVNFALFDLSLWSLSRQKNGTKDQLTHLCDLWRVQIYMILKFDLFQPYLPNFSKQLSVIPTHIGYDCLLVQSMHKFFNSITFQCENQDFNQCLLRQIFETLTLIADEKFDSADQLHFFKVYYLQFMHQKLEDLFLEVFNNKQSLVSSADSLLKLFKINFYPEKYVKIFEDLFDLDSIHDILQLQELIASLENKQKKDAVAYINKVIIQQTAIQLICLNANKNEAFCTLVMKCIIIEIEKNAYNQCDLEGAMFDINSQQFNIKNKNHLTTEYNLKQSGPLLSQYYQYLKLCLGIFDRNLLIEGKIYDIVYHSENHFEKQTILDSSLNGKPQTSNHFCEDCLKIKFLPITLNQKLQAEQTDNLFALLIRKIQNFTIKLDQQDRYKYQFRNLSSIDEQNIIDYFQRIKLSENNFAILEKFSEMTIAFIIYSSQSSSLSTSMVNSITAKTQKPIVSLKDIPNNEFRLLLLRNILFQIEPYSDQALSIFRMTEETVKLIKSQFNIHKENQNYISKLSREPGRAQRYGDRAGSFGAEYEFFFKNQRKQFKKLAEISLTLVSLYGNVVQKDQQNIKLFERKTFLDQVLVAVQDFIKCEQSYISEFISELLLIFFFKSKEDTNPLKFKQGEFEIIQYVEKSTISYINQKAITQEKIFEMVLSTIVDLIKIEQKDIKKTLIVLKQVADTINTFIIKESDYLTPEMIKISRSIKLEGIQCIKKILIFLQENRDSNIFDVQLTINQFSTIIVRMFSTLAKAQQLRDFFSILREILFHNKDMDDIDFNLLLEILKIWNSSLTPSHPKNEMLDFFIFGQNSPGLLLLSNFECQHQVQICLLFKITAIETDKKVIPMVLLSIKEIVLDGVELNVELMVDFEQKTFVLKDFPDNKQKEPIVPFAPIKIENKWHLLVVRLQRSKDSYFSLENLLQMEVYIDQFDASKRILYPCIKSDPKARFNISLGNTVNFCFKGQQTKSFQGRCSLPVFCQGIPDLRGQEQGPAFREFIIDLINTKQIITQKGLKNKIITLEQFTQPIIIAHQILNKQGYTCAVHRKKSSEVYIGIGGFKNMYPLVEKIVKSNLIDLDRKKPAQIFSLVFKILQSLLNQEPAHIEHLMQHRNLIQLLRYSIIKMGKYNVITKDFVEDLKNVVRNSIIEIGKKDFYKEFLIKFVHKILLDKHILTMPVFETVLVINEVVELIHQLCCNSELDYSILRKHIVNKETIISLLQIIEDPQISQIQNINILFQLGEAISSCVLLLEECQIFQNIIIRAQISQSTELNKDSQYYIVTLVYLRIFHNMISDKDFKSKKKLIEVYTKEPKFVIQFDIDSEDLIMDQIISESILLQVQVYISKRTLFGKEILVEQVASQDNEKQQLIKQITESLNQNSTIQPKTYSALILLSFRKNIKNLETDTIMDIIQSSKVFDGSCSPQKIIDFDIDFYFLTLSYFEKYSDQTKLQLLNNVGQFLKFHQENFMKLYSAQKTNTGKNPFNQKLKQFYFEIVNVTLSSNNPILVNQTEQLIVDICINQFIRSEDDKNELSVLDEWCILLFRRIFVFLQSNISKLLTILQRVIKAIVLDLNHRTKDYQQHEQVKLNLKLIKFLQFIEEFYVLKKKELLLSTQFQETFLLIMFLFEQIGLLTMDIPDWASFKIDKLDEDIRNTTKSLNSSQGLKRLNQVGLSIPDRTTAVRMSGATGGVMILRTSVQDDLKTSLRQQTIKKQEGSYVMDPSGVLQYQDAKSLDLPKQKATQNFMSGGPVRIFMHILLNMLVNESNNQDKFSICIQSLRYLVLRERGSFVSKIIAKHFGDIFSTKSVPLYTLFTRGKYIENYLEIRKRKTTLFDSPKSVLEDLKQNTDLIRYELKIFELTIQAIEKTTENKVREEQIADSRQQISSCASYNDLKISKHSNNLLKKEKAIGFTSTDGFLITLVTAELLEILYQIIIASSDDDSMSFQMEENVFVETESDQSISLTFNTLIPHKQLKHVLNNQTKIANIQCLLTFLHDSMQSEFSYKNYEINSTTEKIIDILINTCNVESVETKQKVKFLSQYLEQDNFDEFDSIVLDSPLVNPIVKKSTKLQKLDSIDERDEEFDCFPQTIQGHIIIQNYFDPDFENDEQVQKIQFQDIEQLLTKSLSIEESKEELVFQNENLIKSGRSENFKTPNSDDRTSWVSSIQSQQSPSPQKQKSDVSFNLQFFQSIDASEGLQSQYKQQIIEYIKQLYKALQKFVILRDPQEINNQISKIIEQTLNKEKQRRIYISFAAATSNCFINELQQVRINSTQIFNNIEQEIDQMQSDRKFTALDKVHSVSSQKPGPSIFRRSASIESSTEFKGPFSIIKKQLAMRQSLIDMKLSVDYQHTKFIFKKIVSRLQKDESSLWYDHIEEQHEDFKEIQSIYSKIQQKLDENIKTAEKEQIKQIKFWEDYNVENLKENQIRELNEMLDQRQTLYFNPKQKHGFVAQRRNADSWGRMMLLKPNRKALNYQTWLYYDYYVYDFLNKVFLISLLQDEDFSELVKLEENPDLISIIDAKRLMADPSFEQSFPKFYSPNLFLHRQSNLQKMDNIKLLQRVLSCEIPLKRVFEEDQQQKESQSQKVQAIIRNQKIIEEVFQFETQNIRVKGPLWGTIILTKSFFIFISACSATPSQDNLDNKYTDQTNGSDRLNTLDKKQLFLGWDQIDEIMKCKTMNRFQAIDITTFNKKTYSFNLCSRKKCDEFFQKVQLFAESKTNEIQTRIIENPKQYFLSGEYQFLHDWKIQIRSNMEFLLLVNKFSGRSFNDLSQYPIFPWVLTDYKSNILDFRQEIKKEKCYRDFTKHPGNISEDKCQGLINKYEQELKEGIDEFSAMQYGDEPYHLQFGFSNKMVVTQWLCRMEPFSQMNYLYSDQKRDERLPIDFQISFETMLKNNQSNTELLPEHYYFPEMLMNINKFNLGIQYYQKKHDGFTQDLKLSQDQIFLPPWAANNYDFVRQMREALESTYVTKNLANWIDLVFGVNQSNKDNQNLFFAFAYEEWHENKKNREKIDSTQLKALNEYYTSPSKLFNQSLVQPETQFRTEKGLLIEEKKEKEFTQLIKAFLEFQTEKKKLHLQQITVHNYLEQSTNIIHMMFNNEKKCFVFVRQEDPDKRVDTGNIIVYLCQETLSKESFKEKGFDLSLRFEWVSEDLNNVFQINTLQSGNKLFVCGYLDNSIRIFDLESKPYLTRIVRDHNAKITCIRFSADFKYFISCDSDGLINHYGLQKTKELFPYCLLHKFQDQMDEILAIDTNQTLDMYVTLSRDGTIAVRCQRTSTLWQHFKIFSRKEKKDNKNIENVTGFSQTFRHIYALKLSLHGYIVVIGQQDNSKNGAKYLVYNLQGDTLLHQFSERCQIKNVFLNNNEDLLIIAQNWIQKDQNQGNIRVVKLYQLQKILSLTNTCYNDVLYCQQKNKNQTRTEKLSMPIIQAIAMKKGEASLNIFYEKSETSTKEIICFETSKLPVWTQLEDMALAPRNRQNE